MALTGVDPFDPRPISRREYKPGSGSTFGQATDLPYLLLGNRTTAGSETVDKISDTPIGDDADAIARCGARSALYAMIRRTRAVDPDGRIFIGPVTESGGVASTFKLGITGASSATGQYLITVNGVDVPVAIANGDTQTTTATAIKDALTSNDGGRLQVTAVAAIDGAGPDFKVDITAAQKGPRGDQTLGSGVNRGIRVKWVGPTNTQVLTKNVLTSGTVEDDYTAITLEIEAAAQKGNVYYVVTEKTATSAPTATDNGIGELTAELKRLLGPLVGLDTLLIFAMVDTAANATIVATATAMNGWTGHYVWSKNNDYTTGMIAAEIAAQVRTRQITYPAANLNGLATNLPKPWLNADNPSSTDIKTALNNGYIPIAFERGAMRVVRFITGQSLNAQGINDYRVREGHIPRCQHFGWEMFRQMLEAQAQPNADSDPPDGAVPPALTTTPANIVAVHDAFIDEMVSNAPFTGRYPGPIFKPSAKAAMKKNFAAPYAGGGAFNLSHDWKTVEHRIKTGSEINETGVAYIYLDDGWFTELNPRRGP